MVDFPREIMGHPFLAQTMKINGFPLKPALILSGVEPLWLGILYCVAFELA